MVTDDDRNRRSIMIALDPGSPGRASLEIVASLADRRDRRLLGVAVEDGELIAHARSRLATEIVLSGAARPLDPSRLERQLRAQSALIRRAFEAEAARLGYASAFKVLHGSIAAELEAEAAHAEMLVVELPSAVASHQAAWAMHIDQLAAIDLPAVLYARAQGAEHRGIVALVEGPDDLDAIVRMAGRLARGNRLTLTMLLGERSGAVEQQARTALGDLPAQLRVLKPAEIEAASLGSLTRASDARILIAPAHLTKSDPRLIRELLRRTSCSVMLVDPARAASQS